MREVIQYKDRWKERMTELTITKIEKQDKEEVTQVTMEKKRKIEEESRELEYQSYRSRSPRGYKARMYDRERYHVETDRRERYPTNQERDDRNRGQYETRTRSRSPIGRDHRQYRKHCNSWMDDERRY